MDCYEAQDNNGYQPLHVASIWHGAAYVAYLIQSGSRVHARTRMGLTPLHCAAVRLPLPNLVEERGD